MIAEGHDQAAILGAHVVALPVALRRVVVFPEQLQQVVIADQRRVEDDAHDLGMAGIAALDLVVGRVLDVPAGKADLGQPDAFLLPEQPLDPQ